MELWDTGYEQSFQKPKKGDNLTLRYLLWYNIRGQR